MDEERTGPGLLPYEVRVRPGKYVQELGVNALVFLFCVLLVLVGAIGRDAGVLVDILMRLFGLFLGSATLVAFRKRQPWPDRVLKGIGKLLGAGDWVPVYLPQLDAPRKEVTQRILDIVEAREIEGIREARRIKGP